MNGYRLRLGLAALLAISMLIGTSRPMHAQVAGPVSVAINPATNRVYLANLGGNTLVVIDGNNNSVITAIQLGTIPVGVAVNPTTNRVYVARSGNGGGSVVSVIDGATNAEVATIPVASGPLGSTEGLEVNPATNRVYVAHFGSTGGDFISAIDGASNSVITTIGVGSVPRGVPVVNPTTNRIYVPDGSLTSGNIVAIDGANNTVASTISVGGPFPPPSGIVINPTTNRLYASFGNSIFVIDGNSNAVLASFPFVGFPVAVNPTTNHIYLASSTPNANSVSVIDGANNSVAGLIPVGAEPVAAAVNPATNRVYVANRGSDTVSVIDGANNTVIATISVGLTWFFAEGSTQKPFDTWFLVQNPGSTPAAVRFTFQLQRGGTVTRDVVVAPTSRFSLFANQVLPNAAFSTRIDSNHPIFAERSMFVGYDGADVTGIPGPSARWLFAEGATTPPFQTWLLLQNPNSQPTTARITYLLLGGAAPRMQTVVLPALSRTSIFVNQVLPNAAFSSRVDSDLPIVAERAMYRFPGNAATDNPGVNDAFEHWYFPDANTSSTPVPFDTFLLLQNPNDATVGVAFTLDRDNGTSSLHIRQLPPHSRTSIFLNEVLPNARFGVEVHADLPIIAERSEFFGAEPRGAISTVGATELATTWLLPEGSTQRPFSEVIVISNFSGATMFAHLDFQLPNGQVIGRDVTIGPNRPFRINVGDVVPNSPVSARITTIVPSVVERLMFFTKGGSQGGTDSIGIHQ